MDTLEKAIEAFERVIITGTDQIMKEIATDLPDFANELTKEQRELLQYVHFKKTVTPGDISRYQGVQKSTISNRLNKLIKTGYIEYIQSTTNDRRYRLIRLTDKGSAFITKSNDIIHNVITDLINDIGEKEEQETFLKILNLIQIKIDAKGGK